MKKQKFGMVLAIIGGLLIFGFSWLAPWYTSSVWSSAPPEHFEGTAWAAFGPIFMIMSFGVPLGLLLFTIGLLIYTKSKKASVWLILPLVILAITGMLYPPTTGYYPLVFGIGGGLILLFFFMTVWFWAKKRRSQIDRTFIADDYQLLSYVFFMLLAINVCALVGNPFSGLYFPEKVIRDQSLPFLYSIGLKAMAYFVLAWLFAFLGQLKRS